MPAATGAELGAFLKESVAAGSHDQHGENNLSSEVVSVDVKSFARRLYS
jgi:hypothetical protein